MIEVDIFFVATNFLFHGGLPTFVPSWKKKRHKISVKRDSD